MNLGQILGQKNSFGAKKIILGQILGQKSFTKKLVKSTFFLVLGQKGQNLKLLARERKEKKLIY